MKYAAAIIYYNPDAKIIAKLKKYSEIFEKVYAVDNSDLKNDLNLFCNRNDNVEYHSMNGNKGISEAYNYFVKQSYEDGFDYLLTLDQDSNLDLKSIEILMEYIEQNIDEEIALICPNYCRIYKGKTDDEFDSLCIHKNQVKFIREPMTSGSFLKLSIIINYMPLEDLFIGYVDNDLGQMLYLDGYKCIMIGNAVMKQQIGEPVKSTVFNRFFKVINQSEDRYYYMFRNNRFLYKKNKSNKIIRKSLNICLGKLMIHILIGERNKIKKLKASYMGICDYRKNKMGKRLL